MTKLIYIRFRNTIAFKLLLNGFRCPLSSQQPGELDYAELDDLRPNFRPAPPPSGANARPLVRAPAYEGTEYADITQFGVPQPEPTYGNVPKKDVVYSNVESM